MLSLSKYDANAAIRHLPLRGMKAKVKYNKLRVTFAVPHPTPDYVLIFNRRPTRLSLDWF